MKTEVDVVSMMPAMASTILHAPRGPVDSMRCLSSEIEMDLGDERVSENSMTGWSFTRGNVAPEMRPS